MLDSLVSLSDYNLNCFLARLCARSCQNSRARARMRTETCFHVQVLRAEKEVTLELRRLSNLDIYPAAELAQIRREHGALATEWQQVGFEGVIGGDRIRATLDVGPPPPLTEQLSLHDPFASLFVSPQHPVFEK